MNSRLNYFAYGSNMSVKRLVARVPSAEFICSAKLSGHVLKFNKPSGKDNSGKCNAAASADSNDLIWGAVFSIKQDELPKLDKFEGNGFGYSRRTINVSSESRGILEVETYFATVFDDNKIPLHWYKEHVLRGALFAGLPKEYITMLNQVVCEIDLNQERCERELSIYQADGELNLDLLCLSSVPYSF